MVSTASGATPVNMPSMLVPASSLVTTSPSMRVSVSGAAGREGRDGCDGRICGMNRDAGEMISEGDFAPCSVSCFDMESRPLYATEDTIEQNYQNRQLARAVRARTQQLGRL